MSMAELFSVTLDAKTIRKACEAYVERQLVNTATQEATAIVAPDLTVLVKVSKRRIRIPKPKSGNGPNVPIIEAAMARDEVK